MVSVFICVTLLCGRVSSPAKECRATKQNDTSRGKFLGLLARELFNFFICDGGGFGNLLREIFLLYKKNFERVGDMGSLRERGFFNIFFEFILRKAGRDCGGHIKNFL